MSKILLASFLMVLVASFIFVGQVQTALAKPDNGNAKGNRVRVLADSNAKVLAAHEKGCETVRETKGLKALLCPEETVAALGLREDIRIYKADSAANEQIGADIVQSSGNNGEGRKIAVLDTGYNYNHPELASSYLGGKDFVNNDNDPLDDNGHGSHVAGLITGDGVNSAARGVAPAAGIIVGKVLDSEGSGFFSDLVAAIYWVVDGPDGVAGNKDDFKVDAINLSMGTAAPYLYKTFCNDEMPELTAAIKYAVERKVSVVVAAGNYGKEGVSIPGCISYSLTVGAVNSLDKVASFSGRGKGVDLSAPGVALISAGADSRLYSLEGTSMSTPIVSGTIALIKHEHKWYSANKIRLVLVNSSLDLGKEGRDHSYGYGRVNATAASMQ
jgi:subtilisin